MHIEELRSFCLNLPGAEESFPFDNSTLVFKVGGKMFLLTGLDQPELSFNVKCNPELALELREKYPAVQPGYHMSKVHWNTVLVDGSLPKALLQEWILASYHLVIASLPKKIRENLSL